MFLDIYCGSMGIFEKIMAVKQVSFKDGEITLFNERVLIAPMESIVFITEYLLKNPNLIFDYFVEDYRATLPVIFIIIVLYIYMRRRMRR